MHNSIGGFLRNLSRLSFLGFSLPRIKNRNSEKSERVNCRRSFANSRWQVRSVAHLLSAQLLLLCIVMCWSSLASAQHTSLECPAQTATVSSGGTVTINISDCEVSAGFGGIGAVDGGSFGAADFPNHGTAITRHTGGQWFLDYSHNGTTGIGSTDVFEFSDGSLAGSGDVRVTITINASASPITVAPASLPTLAAGSPFSQTLTSTGGLAAYTYTLQSGVLPIGLSLTSGGVLSGTPTQRGAYSFSVRSRDATTPTAQFVDKGYTGTVQSPSLALATASGTAIQGVAFSQTLSTIGGVAPYSYLLETGAFPTGISISSAGVISGTTNAGTGNYSVTLRVTDASTGPGSYFEVENFTLTVSPPPTVTIAVSPASVAEDGATNLVYTVTRSLNLSSPTTVNITTSGTATSGTDYTGGVATVTIPSGATIATITINPTADTSPEANETVILTVASGAGYTVGSPSGATGTITNDDGAPGTSTLCPNLSATVAYGGSVSINGTSCHAGFGLGNIATQAIHGTGSVGPFGPTQFINYAHNATSGTTDSFVVRDGNSPPNNLIVVNITITPPTSAIVVSPANLPTATAGTPFNQTLISTGGVAPYTYSLSTGALPVGLSLSSAGALSGTPTQRGGYTFSVRSQDNIGDFAVKGYTGTVQNPSLALAAASGTAIQGIAFSQTLSTTGGVAPYSYLLETGAFPTGISISSAGVISGTTNAGTGNYPVTLRVTDASTGPGSYFEVENFTLTVSSPPTVTIAVSPASVAEDGATNLVYTVTRSLNLSSPTTVNITTSGTATSGTDYTGGVATVVIPAGATTATITINPTTDTTVEADETVILTIAAGSGYTVGTPSSATGTITNDDLPSLTINDVIASEGNAGTTNFTFTVSLSAPAGPGGVTFDIATANGTATSGVDYVAQSLTSQTIPAGSSTYTFTVAVNGDTLNEPNENFFVNVTNVTNATVVDSQGVGTITNDDALPSISTSNITVTEGNSGTTNAVVTVTLSAASGQTITVNYATANGTATAPGDYTATSGTLTFTPGQTSRTITVLINGDNTPEVNETLSVGLFTAVNATINVATSFITITNDDAAVAVSPATLPNGQVDAAYNQLITATGGSAPYTFAITAGALPSGMTLSGGGMLTGTPVGAGAFAFTITATEATSATGSQAYSITVTKANQATLTATSTATTVVVGGTATLGTTGGSGTGAVSFASNNSNCSLSGNTLTAAAVGGCIITATKALDANYNVASATVNITTSIAPQTITFAQPAAQAFGTAPTLTATSTSGLIVAFTSATTGVCTITTGGVLTLVTTGTCTINADQAGNTNFAVAPQVTRSFAVDQASQTISFGVNPGPVAFATGSTFNVTATATSALTVGFTVPVTSTVCSVAGNTVTILTAGICTVAANQAGNANFNAAPPITQSIIINQASQTITFTPASPVVVGVTPITLSATSTSGLAAFTFATSSANTICTVTGNQLTIVGVGLCALTANQAGNTNYTAGVAMASITINQGAQSITFAPVASVLSNATPFAVTATGGASGNPVTFASLTATICTTGGTNGATITLTGTLGICSIRASQAASANFAVAANVDRGITVVSPIVPVTSRINLTADPAMPVIGQPITITANIIGNNPTGSVSISEGNSVICSNVALAGGSNSVSCPIPLANRGVGNRTYVASYSGDTKNTGAQASLTVVISAAVSSTFLTASPQQPRAGDSVSLMAYVTGSQLDGGVSFIEAGSFLPGCERVTARRLPGTTDSGVATCTVAAGFTSGLHTVLANYVSDANNLSSQATLNLNVMPRGPIDYSDMWWAGQAENGWGMSISQKGLIQFNAFYVYDNTGKPTWYVMPGGTWNADFTRYTGLLYQPTSAPFDNYDASRFVAGASVGNATLTFTSSSTATFGYTINGISGSKNIVRQPFGSPDNNATLVVNDLWWGGTLDAKQNGWGLAIQQQVRQLFMVWFTYGQDGKPVWYVIPGGSWTGAVFTGGLYATTGSAWLGANYNPALLMSSKVGTLTLDFANPNGATMTTTVNGVTQTKPISRQPF